MIVLISSSVLTPTSLRFSVLYFHIQWQASYFSRERWQSTELWTISTTRPPWFGSPSVGSEGGGVAHPKLSPAAATVSRNACGTSCCRHPASTLVPTRLLWVRIKSICRLHTVRYNIWDYRYFSACRWRNAKWVSSSETLAGLTALTGVCCMLSL